MATKSSAAPAPASRAPAKENRVAKYLGEVRTELKKTNWPSRAELIAQTQVVFGLLIVVGVFVATWDMLLGFIIGGLLRALGVTR
jgi:preprotein translocase subunit SecE